MFLLFRVYSVTSYNTEYKYKYQCSVKVICTVNAEQGAKPYSKTSRFLLMS